MKKLQHFTYSNCLYYMEEIMAESDSLISRILSGDTRAFRILIEENQRLVSHIVFRMVPNRSDREDLCQEVLMKVYQNLSSFKYGSKLSSWIAKIAYNSCIDFLKKNKKHHLKIIPFERADPKDLIERTLSPDEFTKRGEIRIYLKREVEKMPPNFCAILTLFHLEEMSYAEISEIMQLPEGTVKSYLFRARKLLKDRLTSKYQREEI